MTDQADEQRKKKGVSLEDLGYTPIPIELANGSTIKLRFLSAVDERFLADLLDADIGKREFAVALLHHQLLEPRLSQAEVEAWPDEDLQRAARAFAEARPTGLGKPISDGAEVYDLYPLNKAGRAV